MSEDTTAPDPGRRFSVKHPLRTYSRHGRAMKRSSSALAENLTHVTKGDLNVRGVLECLSDPGLFTRRMRTRVSDSLGQRPTDVFWEHLSASAPAFTLLHNEGQSADAVSPKADPTSHEIDVTAEEEPSNVGKYVEAVGTLGRQASGDLPVDRYRMISAGAEAPENVDPDENVGMVGDDDSDDGELRASTPAER